LAAGNGHKHSSEKAVTYESDVSEGVQVKGLWYCNRNDLVAELDNSMTFISRINK
jgi:hypothetical protein